eukprot:347468-Rhodomonas_salina.2
MTCDVTYALAERGQSRPRRSLTDCTRWLRDLGRDLDPRGRDLGYGTCPRMWDVAIGLSGT